MHTGSHGRYSWLISRQMGVGHLLEHCPQALLGHYVVVTSFDSGPLALNESERAMGWHVDGALSYTNQVGSVETLPYDNFDEWYVFKSPVRLTDCEVFVNAGGFTLERPVPADPTWDTITAKTDAERLTAMQARFWVQLERFGAESYISDGDSFLFATANHTFFNDVAFAFNDYA
jgi:hypothetical protein